jgi:hypothetical protein
MPNRSCGSCTACCEGHLYGNAYGNIQTRGTPCRFLHTTGCTIYITKPEFCTRFQCLWLQGLLDDSMRPSECGLLVTVETMADKTQRLHATEVWPQVPLSSYQNLAKWAKDLDTTWELRKYHELQS